MPTNISTKLAVDGFVMIGGRSPEISGIAAFRGLGAVVRWTPSVGQD